MHSRNFVLLAALPLVLGPAAAVAAAPSTSTTSTTSPAFSTRINVGGGAYTDAAGRVWSADRYFSGGRAYTTPNTTPVTNTTESALFRTERVGMASYKIPVPANGIYNVRLRMAEIFHTASAKRVFSISAQGQPAVTDVDLVNRIGARTAYDVTVPVRTTNGTVDLGFSAKIDTATLSAIEVVSAATTTSPNTATQTSSAPAPQPSTQPSTAPTTAPAPQPSTAPSTAASAPASTPPSTTTTSNPWPVTGSRTLYVSPTGNDSNAGTATSPFRQISKAASVATAGTVVRVAPGDYAAVNTSRSGTSTAPITYVSDTKWGAKVTAPGATNVWSNSGQWVVIQGFDLSRARYSGIMSTASNTRFLGNHIHDLTPPDCTRGGAGIEIQNYSHTNVDSIGNVIHDIFVSGDCAKIHGIYYQGPNGGRILNNVVYKTSGWGIHLWHNANGITITHNTVTQNKKGGMVIGGSLEGNDIAPGIAANVVVSNNVVTNNSDWGIREMGRVGKNTYANNLVASNSAGGYSLKGGGVPTGTVTADPQYVNYAGNDFHVRTTSPVIDKGTTTGALNYDHDLAPRPKGAAHDIGAYEGGR